MKIQLSKNVLKRKRAEKKERRRLSALAKAGRLVAGVEIPPGVLAADPFRQVYGGPYAVKYYYKDIMYQCSGCGKYGTWSAEQQKRYFEEQKGNIFNEPKWCHRCHRKRMLARYGPKETQ